ncbi:hypothetical protein BH10ACI4_BH10ACI4_35620 [soil metagenome]
MPISDFNVFVVLLSSTFALSQASAAAPSTISLRQATLPIVFTKTVGADHARAGDAIYARTTQAAKLANGELIPAGTVVVGHVAVANAFVYDKTPYATQQESILAIHFDSLRIAGHELPLKVRVRAMADPLTSWGAREPKSSDLDSVGTVTQIGGDQLVPSQDEVVNRDGDVVAYNRRDGVYAHLIAHGSCDSSTNEVSVGIYSPSACGLYGFNNVVARETGSASSPSTLSLVSTRTSPKVWRNTTALLELLPEAGAAH